MILPDFWPVDRVGNIRPTVFDLIHTEEFDSAASCNATVTNCKTGYYGSNETDPFVSKKGCVQAEDGKWHNVCEMRANRLRGTENISKVKQDFLPNLEFLTPTCAQNPSACEGITYDMLYVTEHMFDNSGCDGFQNEACKFNHYGDSRNDLVKEMHLTCIRDDSMGLPYDNVQYPYCRLQSNLITQDSYATLFYEEFIDTPNLTMRDFTLSAFCHRHPKSANCVDEPGLVEPEEFNVESECLTSTSTVCSQSGYDTEWIKESKCEQDSNGKYRKVCVGKTGVSLTDRDVKKIHQDFNTEVNNDNEIALSRILGAYCADPVHMNNPECVFNSSAECRANPSLPSCGDVCRENPSALECQCMPTPWLEECGGDGDKCKYDPDLPECRPECIMEPWLVECGGDGNKCKYNIALPGCEECATKPWLVECGGDGNICSHDPTLPECADPCIKQPWLVECGGTGDKCKYEPTLPECIITKKRHPLVWISLLGIAIIATYVIMKNKQDVEPEKQV